MMTNLSFKCKKLKQQCRHQRWNEQFRYPIFHCLFRYLTFCTKQSRKILNVSAVACNEYVLYINEKLLFRFVSPTNGTSTHPKLHGPMVFSEMLVFASLSRMFEDFAWAKGSVHSSLRKCMSFAIILDAGFRPHPPNSAALVTKGENCVFIIACCHFY
jgi:hypothetical protein